MPKARFVTILGATGTIGKQTLDVISRHSQKFDVFALTANTKAV
ncbi:MAG: 1-deoxy-D-xylulose-5-phosphate reductoisomerase, partial [Methylophilaceae bacterium]|nr:1-deoxy-D-xylulose-5-phosphate reductoisomerase [Methylophilaceae bacterium]